MAGELVLVIDDSPTITKVVQLVLTKAGFEVITAADGEAGLAVARSRAPDLILLDFVMPRMNGYQFCREAASDETLRDIPVVLMSAKGDQVGERFVKVMGIVDYITKPFSPEAITAVVQHTINKYGRVGDDLPGDTPEVDPDAINADAAREARGRQPSWSVVQVWDQPRRELARFLLLRHQVRERVAFDGLCKIVRNVFRDWRPERVWIEGEALGKAAVSVLGREFPIETIRTQGRDKASRASWLIEKSARGEVFLPKYESTWRPAFEAELLAWTGNENQPADQIDAAAYAAIIAERHDGRPIRIGLPRS